MAWQIMKRFDPEGGEGRAQPAAALARFDAEKRNMEKEES